MGAATWTTPKGGYSSRSRRRQGTARHIVKLAKEAGVELTPAGATHPLGHDPHDAFIRIAPSFPELPEVEQAAEGVVVSVLLAAAEARMHALTWRVRQVDRHEHQRSVDFAEPVRNAFRHHHEVAF